MTAPKLSLLIATVPSRVSLQFPRLMIELLQQSHIYGDPVEILGLFDNKRRTVGEKRNDLLSMARGEWLAFIDDDDRVDPTYVSELLAAIDSAGEFDASLREQPDVICFQQVVTYNGRRMKTCRYGLSLEEKECRDTWQGKPAHTMCWRRWICRTCRYPSINFGEDNQWVERASYLARGEIQIDRVLYFYDFVPAWSETHNYPAQREYQAQLPKHLR